MHVSDKGDWLFMDAGLQPECASLGDMAESDPSDEGYLRMRDRQKSSSPNLWREARKGAFLARGVCRGDRSVAPTFAIPSKGGEETSRMTREERKEATDMKDTPRHTPWVCIWAGC